MKTKLIALSALLAFTQPCLAQSQGNITARPQHDVFATCVESTSDATTYSGGAFAGIATGFTDTDPVAFYALAAGMDGATNFNLSSMSIDAAAMLELSDQGGTGVVNTGAYRGNNSPASSFSLNAWLRSAATIDLSVTFSEAVTGAVVCAILKRNSETTGSGASTQSDPDTDSNALILSYSAVNQPQSTLVGLCIAGEPSVTATWTGLTEVTETCNAEFCWSFAMLDYAGNESTINGANTLTPTCDWSGTADASGTTGGLNR